MRNAPALNELPEAAPMVAPALADDGLPPMPAFAGPEFEYEEERQEGNFIANRITAGRNTKKPGQLHMETPGAFFIGRYQGMQQPEAFQKPILVWRINGELYSCAPWADLVDKLKDHHDSYSVIERDVLVNAKTGETQTVQTELGECIDPQWFRVTFEREDPSSKAGQDDLKRFRVAWLKPQGSRAVPAGLARREATHEPEL